tara:strand:- start:1910 stop:2218 length:309 start_codon:yes stop_codon:yes gene_type:complete
MVIYVDIDNTICHSHKDENGIWDYNLSKPRYNQIEKINRLYKEGHDIVYWTARGIVTGINWKSLTTEQLKDWGCKYTRIEKQSKPHFDLFIDDKAKRIEEIE